MTRRPEELVSLGFMLGARSRIASSKAYEASWSAEWKAARLFEAEPDNSRPKFFICVPYSYQNGPLHLGHGFTFTRGDVIARYKRMKGYNVLFPWAWHWTGEAVAGTSERLRRGDEAIRKMLVEIDGVREDLLEYFENPEFICAYYTAENRQVVDAIGWSVDWTREFYTTSLHPYYSNFINWQYSVLSRKGLVSKGRHPVVWCPRCQSATGDHDRLRGEGIYPEEFTLVFFDMDGVNIVAATLRPETLYGATNLWVNPDAVYQVFEKNGVRFLVSREALNKFVEQWQNVQVVDTVSARELIGRSARAPLTGREMVILPAPFVDPSMGTGVVYSVPAHAPYDYVALRDLAQNPQTLSQYGLNPSCLDRLKPVKVVSVEGYGEFPAVEVVEKMKITSQLDDRLEEATREIYSKEFHTGVMYDGEYKGLPVSQARKEVQQKLITEGRGELFYDLSGKVVCRSGDECIVKIVEDQWFLTFSNSEWKEKVKTHLAEMGIYPEAVRTWFLNVVDWLRDWACTRKTGLGTPLPWDPSWKIETLSDSTIYPALYTVSSILNKHREVASRITPEVLDYVFLGEGDPAQIAERHGIDLNLLNKMRDEFTYWYGVDLRVSGKDLVPNHLTFYLFHHAAIFERRHWPRSISVNGMVSVEGEKMSKSRGNFITLKTAVMRHGADATRLALLLGAEELDDPDWRLKNVEEAEQFIQNFLSIVDRCKQDVEAREGPADKWLSVSTSMVLKNVEKALEKMKTRTACNEAVYGMLNIWRWWLRRNNGRINEAGKKFVKVWTLLLSPFAPFAAEEAWRNLRGEGYASTHRWPETGVDEDSVFSLVHEDVLRELMADVREILKVVKGKPAVIKIFKAAGWKVSLAERLLGSSPSDAFGWLKEHHRDKLAVAQRLMTRVVERLKAVEDLCGEYSKVLGAGDRKEALAKLLRVEENIWVQAAELIKQEIRVDVVVLDEDDASGTAEALKASQSIPLKPAVYVSRS